MGRPYTERLCKGALCISGGAQTTLYTVPANKRAIVRTIMWWTGSGTTTRLVLAVGSTATLANRVWSSTVVQRELLDLRLTLYAGEELRGVADVPTGAYVTATGYVFDDV